MFSSKSANSNKVLAVAFVSMLMICSFGMVLADESDAAYNQTFDIHMREGDMFSYSPAVNLDNTTISADGTAFAGGHLTWGDSGTQWSEGATISGTFPAPGDYQLILTANWTGGSDDSLTQTAVQTINFHVYDRLAFTPSTGSSNYTVAQVTSGLSVDTIRVDESADYAGTVQYTHTITYNDGADNGLFNYDDATGALTATQQATPEQAGTYVVTVTAQYSGDSHGVKDSVTYTHTINVGQNTFTITTNHDDDGTELTYQVTDTSGVSGIIVNNNDGTFTVNTKAVGIIDNPESADAKTFSVTVTVSGDLNDNGNTTDAGETATATITVTIFPELIFMDEPTISNGEVQSATGNALDALATANFEGAKKITYNWGDGTSTTVNVTPDSGSKFSARHVYSQAGTYAIIITAENDKGDMKAYMLYDATNGAWAEATEEEVTGGEDQSFFEEHGILFILFAILAIVMLILFFFSILAPYSLVAAVIFIILTVACFLGADFGLTEGLIEDLNI